MDSDSRGVVPLEGVRVQTSGDIKTSALVFIDRRW